MLLQIIGQICAFDMGYLSLTHSFGVKPQTQDYEIRRQETVDITIVRCETQGRIYSQQGPVQKKCGALQLGRQTLFFPGKKLATFFSHHRPCVSCQFF